MSTPQIPIEGQYAVNDPGTWHTADVFEIARRRARTVAHGGATALFITAGPDTQHRPR